MRKVLFVLLLSVVIAQFSAPNYQERQVYYNEDENVCQLGSGHDWINLDISVDGEALKEVTVNTRNFCDQWEVKDGSRITVIPKWSYQDETNQIKFYEESTPYYLDDDLVGIVVKTTISSPATIEGKQYDCVILGNGEILHYGGGKGTKYEPPTISISCTALEQLQ